jgi:murein DD-endopeptidase MepM/ murein hydrolase activator NlpD
VCLAAIGLAAACATTPVHNEVRPVSTSEAPVAPETMLGLARLASLLDLPFVPGFVDQMVRAQRGMRNFVHGMEDRVASLVHGAGLVVPDLTVLSIEPVAHTESSGFGWRDDPIRHTRSYHSGTDFRGDPGTPVVAAGDGIVTFCGRLGGYGNVIDIDHGGGVLTRYAHLRRIETRKDTAITAGEKIGQVGSTGRTTGPHLHFEVRLDGAPVSPILAMSVAALQREAPLAGRLAAIALSPELQAAAESEVDPPRQRAKPAQRPERAGRTKRHQVLW